MGANTRDYMPPQQRSFTTQQQVDTLYRLVGQLWSKFNAANDALQKLVDTYSTLSSKRILELIRDVQTSITTEEDVMYQTIVDDAGGGVTYVGEAAQGAAQNSSSWRILKITTADGDSAVQLSANYDDFGDNWTDRATGTYS